MVDLHRPLTPHQDLAASLSHVDDRVITNDYTFSFAGRRYQIARREVKGAMKGQHLRIEVRLSGELRARYQGQYCAKANLRLPSADPICPGSSRSRPTNLCAKITMPAARVIGCACARTVEGFFDRSRPELWQAIQIANDKS